MESGMNFFAGRGAFSAYYFISFDARGAWHLTRDTLAVAADAARERAS
jgi:hypothetical protein